MGAFRMAAMRMTVAVALLACLAAVVVASTDAMAVDDTKTMSRADLIAALKNSRKMVAQTQHKLRMQGKKIHNLNDELDAVTDEDEYEGNRKANEKDVKAKQKKKADAKKAKKMKKEKLSDLIMENAAKFLAFKAAKKTANKGSVVQKKAILEAARKGGRAGAAGPLKKVVRADAIAAVKKARAAAKKAGKTGKHTIRKIALKAAKDAVNKLIKEQDDLIEAAAQKFLKEAVKKHPPSAFLAEDDDKPNHFTAPPGIHLSMEDAAPAQVEPIKDEKPSADAIVPEKKH